MWPIRRGFLVRVEQCELLEPGDDSERGQGVNAESRVNVNS